MAFGLPQPTISSHFRPRTYRPYHRERVQGDTTFAPRQQPPHPDHSMPNSPLSPMEDARPGPVLHARANGHGGCTCICGTKFRRADALKRHITCKTKEPQHFCPHCDKAFHRRYHLDQHMRRVHRNDGNPRGLESQEQVPAPASEIQSLGLGQSQVSGSQLPQFPCPLPGCISSGEFGYNHQYHLNEHLIYYHHVPSDVVYTYAGQPFMPSFPMNNEFGQAQGAQWAFQQDADSQLDPARVYQENNYGMAEGALQGFQMEEELNFAE